MSAELERRSARALTAVRQLPHGLDVVGRALAAELPGQRVAREGEGWRVQSVGQSFLVLVAGAGWRVLAADREHWCVHVREVLDVVLGRDGGRAFR